MRNRHLLGVLILTVLAGALALVGCSSKVAKKPGAVAPPPTFTGPEFLHGTIASLATLRGYFPLYVSGYGVVANLPGTGSSEIPAHLRQRMLLEARNKGWGSASLGTSAVSPQAFLASPNTAIVQVEGLIPPAAVRGTTFDILVTALPGTQTTSLEHGVLYTTELGVRGTSVSFAREQARAAGPTYLHPFDESETPEEERYELRRQVVVLSGGTVTNDRRLELVLNQPSWTRSRLIADRINERFPKAPTDREDTAVAKTDMIIRINIPARFGADPKLLLDLMSHLYIQKAPHFEVEQARRLGEVLVKEPRYATDVVLAWRALGKTAVPVISAYYDHELIHVRLAALEAGAGLGDEAVTRSLEQLAAHEAPAVRLQVAKILINLPRSLNGSSILRGLLDDADTAVRIAAYETLSAIGDPAVQRVVMTDQRRMKFILDLLPAEKPLIYISQVKRPRVVIFNKTLGFNMPLSASMWEGRLRLRGDSPDQPVSIFYQPAGQAEGKVLTIAPTVANLAFALGQSPSAESPADGYNLSYSAVVEALYLLVRSGKINAPIELQRNPLASAIAEMNSDSVEGARPETEADTVNAAEPGLTPVEAVPGEVSPQP